MSEKIPNMYEPQPIGSQDHLSERKKVELYIRSFEKPAEHLLGQLEKNIEAGTYSHIIGVETSGRIPALIVGEYISEVHKKKGIPPPKRLFAKPEHSASSTPQLKELFAGAVNFSKEKKKVLLIDDTLYRGISMKDATHELRAHEVPFDIGIFLAVNKGEQDMRQFQEALGADNLYVGDFTSYSDGVFDSEVAHPIVKRKDLLGVRRSDYRLPVNVRHIPDEFLFRFGRKDIESLVDRLLAKRDSRSKPQKPRA